MPSGSPAKNPFPSKSFSLKSAAVSDHAVCILWGTDWGHACLEIWNLETGYHGVKTLKRLFWWMWLSTTTPWPARYVQSNLEVCRDISGEWPAQYLPCLVYSKRFERSNDACCALPFVRVAIAERNGAQDQISIGRERVLE